jgi:hypothetical protein
MEKTEVGAIAAPWRDLTPLLIIAIRYGQHTPGHPITPSLPPQTGFLT